MSLAQNRIEKTMSYAVYEERQKMEEKIHGPNKNTQGQATTFEHMEYALGIELPRWSHADVENVVSGLR